MDLRIVKTRRSIRKAFLELRSKNALEKIRVTRLCEMALINKTTFYKHYRDVYALSEEIEDETIASIMNSFEDMNALFTDPAVFVRGLYFAFKAHGELILTLFSGRVDNLVEKVERQLITFYPRISGSPEDEITLSFLLWGTAHVLTNSKYEETILLDTSTKIAKEVVSQIDDGGQQNASLSARQ